jgi:hypothetical protein
LKNNFKEKKQIKRIRVKLKNIKQKYWLNNEIKRKDTSTKGPREKIKK